MKTTVASEASPQESPPAVEQPGGKPQMTAAESEPLCSGYALTPGTLVSVYDRCIWIELTMTE